MKLDLDTIATILGATPEGASAPGPSTPPRSGRVVEGCSIDTRTLRPGELFFAIAGEHHDGHDHVEAALAAGAVAAVVSKPALRSTLPGAERAHCLRVPDTLAALQQLAQWVRRQWGGPLVAVTGSAGKTTTKEMIAAVLATRMRVLKSAGNFNNHYGVPLSLLRLETSDDVAVIEMGMNHAGEIARLAEIARPNIGVFTNVGEAHLANFSSIEGIASAKRELALAIPADGTLVLNGDDARVAAFGDGLAPRRLLYHRPAPALELHYLGRHHQSNAAAALAAASLFGIDEAAARAALAQLTPGAGRGQLLRSRGLLIINDCYNSNPQAVEEMLAVLASTPGQRHVAVLGEMRELGAASAHLHRAVGHHLAHHPPDAVFAVEGEAHHILDGARASGFAGHLEFCPDASACGQRLQQYLHPGDVVLLKASRGVGLERALPFLLGDHEPG